MVSLWNAKPGSALVLLIAFSLTLVVACGTSATATPEATEPASAATAAPTSPPAPAGQPTATQAAPAAQPSATATAVPLETRTETPYWEEGFGQ